MNWLDPQTKAMLLKGWDPKLAPPTTAEFALVLLQKGTGQVWLANTICRIKKCGETEAARLASQSPPVTIHLDMTQEEALSAQFELICCDAIAVFVRSEVLEEGDRDYVSTVFQVVMQSPEFTLVRIGIEDIPATEAGRVFVEQFLGAVPPGTKRRVSRFSVVVPFKKARIMAHWARRMGATVEGDAFRGESNLSP